MFRATDRLKLRVERFLRHRLPAHDHAFIR